jgi:hypothetical protein
VSTLLLNRIAELKQRHDHVRIQSLQSNPHHPTVLLIFSFFFRVFHSPALARLSMLLCSFPLILSQSSEAARVVEAKKRALQAQLAETRAIAQSYAKQESNLLDA